MEQKIHISLDDRTRVQMSSGSSDYNELSNKPQINGVTLENNKTAQELNLATNTDLERYFGLYFKSVDYVFAGINPELELLENPVQVVISDRYGYVNLDYSFDLVLGKNYHVKCTIGKLDGSVEDFEFDCEATVDDDADPTPNLVGLFYKSEYDENHNSSYIWVTDKYHNDDVYGENFSCLEAGDTLIANWSYVTFTSIVQKEKTSANLLKEPIVVTQEEIDAGGSRGVMKTLNKAIGLEIDKVYDLTIVQNGVETIVTAGTVDGKANAGTTFSFPIIITATWLPDSLVTITVYDGVDVSSDAPALADKSTILFSPYDMVGAFELTSIKEHANLEDWAVPLVVTIDNPQKVPYDKYYKKTGSLFTSAGQNVKVTGSLVVDGQAKPFDVEKTTMGDTGAYYVDCTISELDQNFVISDGAFSGSLGGAFPASYMTLEIDNSYPDGSPMSELRIDSITVT